MRRWIEQGGLRLPSADPVDLSRDHAKAAFVPVQLDTTAPPTAPDIRIKIERSATTVVVSWPLPLQRALPGFARSCVDPRRVDLDAGHRLEFLSDNGRAYIAANTRAPARSLGLQPINTPVCSPQSNGMAESFVNTFKRDYVTRMDLHDAQTVLAQSPAAFEHFNEGQPPSSLKMRSPREFTRQQAAQVRQEPSTDPALDCR